MKKETKIKLLNYPSKLLGYKTLLKKSQHPIIFPFWHTVSDNYESHINSLYTIYNKHEFNNSIEYLLKYFTPIDIESILNNKFDSKKRYMHISFDDGLLGVYKNAIPLLLEKGIPASIFINPSFINNKDYLFRYYVSHLIEEVKNSTLKNNIKSLLINKLHNCQNKKEVQITEIEKILNKPIKFPSNRIYMNKSEILDAYNKGFHIGSHSMNHPNFNQISEKEQQREIIESTDFIQKHWPSKINSFAFPYSDFGIDKQRLSYLQKKTNLDISFGTGGFSKHENINHFQRIPMELENSFSTPTIIKSELLASKLKRKHR